MRALVLAALVAAPALAGCLVPDVPLGGGATAALVCEGSVCNFEATVEPEARQGNEVSVAVNPRDPRNVIATAKDYNPDDAGDCVYAGVYVTKDGGATWTNANVPGSPWRRLKDPSTPVTPFSKFWCVTDPVLAFGPDGTAYWTVMPYQCDAASGSKTGRGVLPQGGFNDWLWTCSAMYVLVSEDGGETWPVVREVAVGPRLEHDKQWISASPDGRTVLLCWDRSAQKPTDESGILCAASGDKGRTWSEPTFAGAQAGVLPWIDHGPDGRAWMASLTFDTGFAGGGGRILVQSSDDGLAWDAPAEAGTYENPPAGGEYGWPVLRGSDFRIFALPSLAVDRSDGPWSGSVYVTWFDHSQGRGDTVFAWSRDGETWSEPVRMRAPGTDADQFMPAVSVGPDGTVDLSWYDRRDDPANRAFDLYYAYSLDGGATFSDPVRVTDVSSDEKWSHHQNGMVFLGDYRDSDSIDGRATLVWVDTRNEKADVMVAHVERPRANAG